MWNQRYSGKAYVYGTEPNDFLREQLARLPRGRALCLAEGEGRNAVWLARQGYVVTAVDASDVGLAKARQLAEKQGVEIDTQHCDLRDYPFTPGHWDLIVSIFCHLPPELRQNLHRHCVAGLHSGGALLLEAYTPAQLVYRTGGPPVAELMMDAASLRKELAGLEFELLRELERELHEGVLHDGTGAVVQVLAHKP